MGGPSRRFLCLFWRETRQRIFGPEISPYPEVVRGHEKRVGWTKELAGSWRRDSREASQQRVGVEPRRDAVDSGDSSRQDRVQRRRLSQKMSAFQLLVEFSLVTHASVSPHMHVVLHTLLLLWVNPKHCSCLFVCFIFSCPPQPDRILVVPRIVRYPPRATSWSPAGWEVKWLEEDECVWGRGV